MHTGVYRYQSSLRTNFVKEEKLKLNGCTSGKAKPKLTDTTESHVDGAVGFMVGVPEVDPNSWTSQGTLKKRFSALMTSLQDSAFGMFTRCPDKCTPFFKLRPVRKTW